MKSQINKKYSLTAAILVALLLPTGAYALLPPPVDSGPVTSAAEPVQNNAAQAVSDQDIGKDSGFNNELGALSRSATRYQLSLAEEKLHAEYLRQKKDRLTIENEMKEIGAPKPIPAKVVEATEEKADTAAQVKKANTIHFGTAFSPRLIEVAGTGDRLVAKIATSKGLKSLVIGDKVDNLTIREITVNKVIFNNGTHIDL